MFDIRDCYLVLTLVTNTERRFEAQFVKRFYPKQWKHQKAPTKSFEDFFTSCTFSSCSHQRARHHLFHCYWVITRPYTPLWSLRKDTLWGETKGKAAEASLVIAISKQLCRSTFPGEQKENIIDTIMGAQPTWNMKDLFFFHNVSPRGTSVKKCEEIILNNFPFERRRTRQTFKALVLH